MAYMAYIRASGHISECEEEVCNLGGASHRSFLDV